MTGFFLSSAVRHLSSFLPEPVKPHDFAAATVGTRRVRGRSSSRRRQRFRLGFLGGPLGCGAFWFFGGRLCPGGRIACCGGLDGLELEAELDRRIVEGRHRLERNADLLRNSAERQANLEGVLGYRK